jgi:hypothetical protein
LIKHQSGRRFLISKSSIIFRFERRAEKVALAAQFNGREKMPGAFYRGGLDAAKKRRAR